MALTSEEFCRSIFAQLDDKIGTYLIDEMICRCPVGEWKAGKLWREGRTALTPTPPPTLHAAFANTLLPFFLPPSKTGMRRAEKDCR